MIDRIHQQIASRSLHNGPYAAPDVLADFILAHATAPAHTTPPAIPANPVHYLAGIPHPLIDLSDLPEASWPEDPEAAIHIDDDEQRVAAYQRHEQLLLEHQAQRDRVAEERTQPLRELLSDVHGWPEARAARVSASGAGRA